MKPQKGPTGKEEEEYDYMRKIIIIGDSGVGKSSLMIRFTEGQFVENYMMTIGISHSWKMIQVDNMKMKLNIWDTAGQEKYKTITRNYYRNTNGAIIAFSINSSISFCSVRTWIDDLTAETKDDISILLIGTKNDLEEEREVTTKEARQFAQSNGLPYMQCSAKNDDSVQDVFLKIARMIKEKTLDHVKPDQPEPPQKSVKLIQIGKDVHTKCCRAD